MNNPYVSILTAHINTHGRVIDAIICKEIAAFINTQSAAYNPAFGNDALFEFIMEHGEDEDCQYIGRDEYGEKQYITHNPDTNWHERIRKELVALDYYLRFHNEWEAKQNELLQAS